MFTELDLSLARERRERLLREVNAARLEGRLRANRDRDCDRGFRTSRLRRATGALLPRWFASRSARPGRTGRKGVGLGDA